MTHLTLILEVIDQRGEEKVLDLHLTVKSVFVEVIVLLVLVLQTFRELNLGGWHEHVQVVTIHGAFRQG